MTRRADLDATLQTIDATLADYQADRREAWIEENLNHPGQMHVSIASASWFKRWEEGELSDDEAQRLADEVTATVEAQAAHEFADRVVCWYCDGWARPGRQMHGYCRRQWAAAKRDRARDSSDRWADPSNPHGWARCLRSDGTGWGEEWDEEGLPLPPAELVDGIGLTVGPHVFYMAKLK